MADNIVLISLSQDQLKEIVREAVHQELSVKHEKEFLNFKETCALLTISPSALNKWKSKNLIPFQKLGKRIFFKREELMKSLKDSNYIKYKELINGN